MYKELKDNIDSYIGKLVWFNGKIEKEYEGSTSGTYQTWVFVTPPSGTSGWRDRMLILHSLERGPRLQNEAKVQFVGTVIKLHEGGLTIRSKYVSANQRVDVKVPMISIVKAEVISDPD